MSRLVLVDVCPYRGSVHQESRILLAALDKDTQMDIEIFKGIATVLGAVGSTLGFARAVLEWRKKDKPTQEPKSGQDETKPRTS
jgi:hypothetical protein